MQIQDVANRILDAIEKGNIRSTSKLFTDDFRFSGPVPVAMDKDQFFSLMSRITNAVPDYNFNRHDLRVEGQTVTIPVQISGTQTRKLQSLMPGMQELPPSNRSFKNPPETIHMTFRGDRVANVQVDQVPGGGVQGMLEQLGAVIPVTGKNNPSSGSAH